MIDKLENTLKNNKIFITIILFIVGFSLVIGSNQGVFAITYSGHDDLLFLNLANNILQGKWLGEYNNLTLAKGPFYPLFISLNFLLGFPLLLSQHVLYILSGLSLIFALSFFVKSRFFILLIFLSYTYNPISFLITNVVRDGIYYSLTMTVFAGAIGWMGSLSSMADSKNIRISLYWSIYLGLSLSLFWLTREEGIWILPSLSIIVLSISIKLIKSLFCKKWKRLKVLLISLSLPFLIFLTVLSLFSAINFINYRVFTTVDMKSNVFLEVNGSLTRVKAIYKPFIPVTQEAREKIYQISPSFSKLKPFLESNNGFKQASCSSIPSICRENDYGGGWFVWALRQAVEMSGHYKDARETERFYQQITQEINRACLQKELDCKPLRKSLAPEFRSDYVRPLSKLGLDTLKYVLTNIYAKTDYPPSLGTSDGKSTIETILFYQDITHNRVNPFSVEYLMEQQLSEEKTQYLKLYNLNTFLSQKRTLSIQAFKSKIIRLIGSAYALFLPILFWISMIVFITTLVFRIIKKQNDFQLWTINVSLLLAALTRIVLLSYINLSSFPSISIRYLAPCTTILVLWIVLVNIDGISIFRKNSKTTSSLIIK